MSEFDFMVHVRADEWAFLYRRVVYMEAVLAQVLGERERVKEWFDAGELAAFLLPGLPGSKAAITRLATAAQWRRREQRGRGGLRFQYHCASLPERAFEALVSRIRPRSNALPDDCAASLVPEVEIPPAPPPLPENTAPPWVLPFMRLLKGGARGDMGAAWRALPAYLPPGVVMPTEEEAAITILNLGLG